MSEPIIEIKNVKKAFDGNMIVKGMDLTIYKGEFLTLLGPSGCGKTTLLRMLGGFLEPDSGEILLGGKSLLGVPPYLREVNTVFQSYALFPNLTVRENIGFGLKMKKLPKNEIDSKVQEIIEMCQLEMLANRKPSKLSGGQQQRVAIARSLVNEPKVLLLDEPLGALDLQLRKQMQISLKRLQRKLGMTYVYVTHDQEEAMTLSDRIAVINNGRIEQLGTPSEIYETPATSFSARFLGESNFFDSDNGTEISIRPEFIQLTENYTKGSVQGTVKAINFLGAFSRITVEADADGKEIFSLEPSGLKGWHSGDKVFINWEKENEQHIKKDA
ncbi:MAG: ABC transporter ATP-binding protein [Treponema sp.]|nr:ABC transporter ATP-binding protein [Treponema sp.]